MRPAAVLAVAAAAVVTGCTVAPQTSGDGPVRSVVASALPSLEPSPSIPQAGASSAASPSTSRSTAASVKLAAVRLLQTEAAEVELTVVREKRPTDPTETLITGTGRIEPAGGLGHVRYDLRGIFARPGASPVPSAPDVIDVIWTPSDVFVRLADRSDDDWEARTREDGRRSGGLIGRLPDEVLGLVSLVAGAEVPEALPIEPSVVDGATADRWMITVPVESAAAAGVPADTPNADVIRRVYGVSAIRIEVWLVDDAVRRLRLDFERAEAPYGGPDRTTITYDWQPARSSKAIELPGSAERSPQADTETVGIRSADQATSSASSIGRSRARHVPMMRFASDPG